MQGLARKVHHEIDPARLTNLPNGDRMSRLESEVEQLRARVAHLETMEKHRAHQSVLGHELRIFLNRQRHRLKMMMGHRLGVHHQYSPRKLRQPASYSRLPRLANPPTFCLVTPSFNQARFLERTLESVIGQNYPNLTYVVQDGGSNDASAEILQRCEPRLHAWESRSDRGQSHAINLGFERIKPDASDIMAYLNSDDLLLTGALHYVAAFFERHPEVDVVYGHRVLIDSDGLEVGRWVLPSHDDDVLSWTDFVPQETLFWRRGIWNRVGGQIDESFRFAMDWDLLIRFRDAGARFQRLPRFLGAFRVHEAQKTSSQINDIGNKEMDRLRLRCLGFIPSPSEVVMHTQAYRHRASSLHRLYSLGLARF